MVLFVVVLGWHCSLLAACLHFFCMAVEAVSNLQCMAGDLAQWSLALDDVIPRQEASGPTAGFLEMARCQGPADDAEKPASGPTAGFLEMARWLVLARFVAQRGQDGG